VILLSFFRAERWDTFLRFIFGDSCFWFLVYPERVAGRQIFLNWATLSAALVLWVGRGRVVVVVAVVEDFADAATCAFGDFAGALGGTYADVLAGGACTFADVARGVDWVEGDEIAGAFADALGCLSGSFGGALADVSGSAADITAGAAGLGWGLGLGGCGLGVLGGNALGGDGES